MDVQTYIDWKTTYVFNVIIDWVHVTYDNWLNGYWLLKHV